MITVSNLSKNFDQRLLFKDVSLGIFPNEKIGLTGPNGAGKSTLFALILGELEPSAGTVQIQKNIRMAHLPQEHQFHSQRTVLEEVTEGDPLIRKLKEEKFRLEEQHKADSQRYGDILLKLETLGIYEIEHKAEKILSGLGFQKKDIDRPVNQLSGGWQIRTLLAKLLVHQYDILLLDEPTNHLDLPATLWLKDFLSGYMSAYIIISHDKIFLNEVTSHTIILEDGRLTKVKGNYAQYEATREQHVKYLERKKKEVDKKRQQLERFTQRFHAQPNRAAAVRNKRKMIERLEQIDLPEDKKSIEDFQFPQTERSGYNVVSLNGVSKTYGDIKVYEKFNFELLRQQRVCLIGANGAGKSTLLKMLAGVVEPDTGKRRVGHKVEVGYFSQTRLDVLNPNRTVLDEVASTAQGSIPGVQVRTLLGLFHFRGDDVFKLVKVLSGGEKSRVILAKLLINPPNCIFLDEPTTHLDIDGVEALTRAFSNYQGTLCFISHDLFFIREIATQIVEIKKGAKRVFPGGLDYYLSKNQETIEAARKESKKQKSAKKETKEKEKKKTSEVAERLQAKHQAAVKRIKEIKKEIKVLEKEKSELETENYVKARVLSEPFKTRDKELLKEYGQRLKFIQKRSREIDVLITELEKEREGIQNA